MSAPRRQSKTRVQAQKKLRQQRILAAILAAILLLVLSVTIYTISRLTYNKVYKGVSIHGVNVSGTTREELRNQLPTAVDVSDVYDITIEIDGAQETISTLSLSPAPDLESMINEAFSYGRTKKGLARLGEISDVKKNPVDIPYMLSLDEYALQRALDKLADKLNVRAVDNKIEIGTDSVHITRGVPGRGIIYDDVKQAVTACMINDETHVSLSKTSYVF